MVTVECSDRAGHAPKPVTTDLAFVAFHGLMEEGMDCIARGDTHTSSPRGPRPRSRNAHTRSARVSLPRRHARPKVSNWRPSVTAAAGSGDPRRARPAPSAGYQASAGSCRFLLWDNDLWLP